MKKNLLLITEHRTYLLFMLFLFSLGFSQERMEVSKIAEREKKAFRATKLNTLQSSVITVYDVQHYKLDITVDPGESSFSGNTEIKFKALQNLTQIVLDAKTNLTVSNFIFNGTAYTTFSHSGDKLIINFPLVLLSNSVNTLKVNYTGVINNDDGIFNDSHNGVPVLSTQSECFHAASWWICKDDLTDKADEGADIYITHPNSMKAGANGTLQEVVTASGTQKRTHWKTSYPIVPYLIGISVTNYAEYNNSANIGGTIVPIINYVYPEYLAWNQADLDMVPSYMQLFSSKVGDYPFKNEKYGHCQWNVGGGMEHATMSFVDGFNDGIVTHELAHQWFGNWVTCGSWKDIWLNEGFASYFAILTYENVSGGYYYNLDKASMIDSITALPNGSVYINNDADALDENRIFDGRLSYSKGAMVLNMLRFKLGDTIFFQALKDYLTDADLAHNFATTPDLISHLNAASGQDLQEFFNDWVYGEGYPTFNINVSDNTANVTLKIDQTQSHPSVSFFETPFDIAFQGPGPGEKLTKKFNLTTNGQIFTLTNIPFNVTSYTFNPNNDIICKIGTTTLQTEDMNNNSVPFSLYPNPVKDKLNIRFAGIIDHIRIYNAAGQLTAEVSGNKSNEQILDTSGLSNGTYVVSVTSDGKTTQEKFIVKK